MNWKKKKTKRKVSIETRQHFRSSDTKLSIEPRHLKHFRPHLATLKKSPAVVTRVFKGIAIVTVAD
ncbi:hypothetical protein E2C01_014114 [Portunus trituberculatus]|uniref:Uncharacterized protein n=1 Tax=Portunus trituberculatus TaxID=210409 RepID=A0A5B7DIB0_PORTR|nr:hypothetical protein [Portunus trituberculatus]